MFDFIKELIEKPENAKKYFLVIINAIFISIITSKVYINFFGNYELIVFSETNFWDQLFEFLISGRVIIIVFIFFFIKYSFSILTNLILDILRFFLNLISKSGENQLYENDIIRESLILFKVVKIDKVNKVVEPARHFDDFYSFITSSTKDQFIESLSNFKNSLLTDIYSTFLFFIVVYYFFITIDKPLAINWFIIICFCLLTFSLFYLSYVSVFINKGFDNILIALNSIKQIEFTNTFIKENGFKVTSDIKNSIFNSKTIIFNDNSFYLQHNVYNNKMLKSLIENINENENKVKVLLIISNKLPLVVTATLIKYPEVNIIEFDNEEQLLLDLTTYFKQYLK